MMDIFSPLVQECIHKTNNTAKLISLAASTSTLKSMKSWHEQSGVSKPKKLEKNSMIFLHLVAEQYGHLLDDLQSPLILGLKIEDVPVVAETSLILGNKLHLPQPSPCTTATLRQRETLVLRWEPLCMKKMVVVHEEDGSRYNKPRTPQKVAASCQYIDGNLHESRLSYSNWRWNTTHPAYPAKNVSRPVVI
jgi:hypothetical protein